MFKNDSFHPGMKREAILLFIAIAFIGLSQGFSENIWTNYYKSLACRRRIARCSNPSGKCRAC
jgi:hypothetical protein